jgi:peptidoglycan/LPS O-acetylase OafA/YrhL
MTAASSPVVADRRNFPGLSGARAVAAFAVVGTHAAFQSGRSLGDQPFAGLLARLDFGVTIFFLLSGFLLSRPFLLSEAEQRRPPPLRTFWWRRALRILPAYWLAVVVTLSVVSTRHSTAGDWISYLTLTQTYDHHSVSPYLSQMWTLSVELSFYAALPLLMAVSRRLPGKPQSRTTTLLVVMFFGALAGNLIAHRQGGGYSPALLWLPLYLDWFALGIALASMSVHARAPARWQRRPIEWAQAPGTCWVIGALLLWLSTLPLAGPRDLAIATTWEWTFKHLLYGASAFFLLLPLVLGQAQWQDRLLGNRVMRWLGEISYGVYLWHLGLLMSLRSWLGWPLFRGHFAGLFVLTVLAATAIAATSWYLFERPLLRRFSTSRRRGDGEQGTSQHDTDGRQTQQLLAGAAGQRVT